MTVRGDVSSQFTSALLMALPILTATGRRALTVEIAGELISQPYVAITTHLMGRFGVAVEQDGWRSFRVPSGARYASPGSIHVEGDASSASYFLAAGAIGGGPVRVTGVGRRSIQGDVAFADALARMGAVIHGGDDWIEARAGRALDGIGDRLHADPRCRDDAGGRRAVRARAHDVDRHRELAREGDRSHRGDGGRTAQAGRDRRGGRGSLTVHPPGQLTPATIATYDDHRMAMCFSLAALGGVAVRIADPDCVRKTFPGYFAALSACRA